MAKARTRGTPESLTVNYLCPFEVIETRRQVTGFAYSWTASQSETIRPPLAEDPGSALVSKREDLTLTGSNQRSIPVPRLARLPGIIKWSHASTQSVVANSRHGTRSGFCQSLENLIHSVPLHKSLSINCHTCLGLRNCNDTGPCPPDSGPPRQLMIRSGRPWRSHMKLKPARPYLSNKRHRLTCRLAKSDRPMLDGLS